MTTSSGFLSGRYLGADVVLATALPGEHDTLLATGSVRTVRGTTTVTGLVDPAHRGSGLGSTLLDRLLATAAERQPAATVRVETESLTTSADRLFTSRGLHRTFAEDVLRLDLTHPAPGPEAPPRPTSPLRSGATATGPTSSPPTAPRSPTAPASPAGRRSSGWPGRPTTRTSVRGTPCWPATPTAPRSPS
ncbi:GNAT family N-acetyltransferase [Kitasatospora aburaviensis]